MLKRQHKDINFINATVDRHSLTTLPVLSPFNELISSILTAPLPTPSHATHLFVITWWSAKRHLINPFFLVECSGQEEAGHGQSLLGEHDQVITQTHGTPENISMRSLWYPNTVNC